MILNVSGRTDIIGFYSEWFFKRLKAGFVDVRNPFNPQFVSRYSLKKEDVDILVITTKNPLPLLSHLDMLSDYTCLFQITLTPYGKDLEPRVPDKIRSFQPFRILLASLDLNISGCVLTLSC